MSGFCRKPRLNWPVARDATVCCECANIFASLGAIETCPKCGSSELETVDTIQVTFTPTRLKDKEKIPNRRQGGPIDGGL